MHEPRILGGYAVIATPATIARTRRATEQADQIAAALAAVREMEQGLLALKFDVAVRLHDAHQAPWKAVARRFRTTEKLIHRFVSDRKRRGDVAAPAPLRFIKPPSVRSAAVRRAA